jgi:hypothetical protein
MSSATVRLTAYGAQVPADDTILLPRQTTRPDGHRLLVEGNSKSKLMKAGSRSDDGTAACVSGATLIVLGGEGGEVSYKGVGFVGVLTRDRSMLVEFLILILTAVGTLITAWLTYIKNEADSAGDFANNTAMVALVIAVVLALLKFLKDYRDL